MTRRWLGVALLASSWLFGLQIFHAPDWLDWLFPAGPVHGGHVLALVMTLLAAGLLMGRGPLPARGARWLALACFLPVAFLMPWPWRGAWVAVCLGLAVTAFMPGEGLPGAVGKGILRAGIILIAQSLAILVYLTLTSRSHDLPWPIPQWLAGAMRLFGVDAAGSDGTIAVHSMRKVHPLAASWELLLDPATLAFLVGGLTLIGMEAAGRTQCARKSFTRHAGILVLCLALWLPLRSALIVAIYFEHVLRTEYDTPLFASTLLWNLWLHTGLIVAFAVTVARFIGLPRADAGPEPAPARAPRRRIALAFALALLSTGSLTGAWLYDPPGQRRGGRVLMDEFHSGFESFPDRLGWEPSTRVYDTEWYGHDSGYTYACVYDYASRFFDMDRLMSGPITDATLARCDVLILKIPTRPFAPEEIEAVLRFTRSGGGLLLIGEHTNVFGSGVYLNSIARRLGFHFRPDCLYDIDKVFEQHIEPPLVPHPIVQNMGPFDFAGPCSIAPGWTRGRAILRGGGLRSIPADYYASNFLAQVEDRPESRYGAFVQLWSQRYGKGRVVAFTDSTVFSNFCAFEPGKAELMLGMIQWLNHGDTADPGAILFILGVALGAGALWTARGWRGAWLCLPAAGALGWSVSVVAVSAAQTKAMPPPVAQRPLTLMTIDQTLNDVILPRSGFIKGDDNGFGIFERWILRVGCFTRRAPDTKVLWSGAVAVLPYPAKNPAHSFVRELVDFVERGGKALILDSPDNKDSTADSLLGPFGLTIERAPSLKGNLESAGWPAIPVESAYEIKGGESLAAIDGKSIAAVARKGRGAVYVIGFGSRFADSSMGATGDVEPDKALRDVFEVEFRLLREIVAGGKSGGPAWKPDLSAFQGFTVTEGATTPTVQLRVAAP